MKTTMLALTAAAALSGTTAFAQDACPIKVGILHSLSGRWRFRKPR